MRSALFAIAAALLVGCATTSDPIDHLVASLSATHGMWQNGSYPILNLPPTASAKDVIQKRFEMGLALGEAPHYKILKIRQVHIPTGAVGSDSFTAVLVRLNSGDKIVLINYCGPPAGWWSRIYDVKPSA